MREQILEQLGLTEDAIAQMPADERRANQREVALGYSEAQARVEAIRCLQCKNAPCIKGCPVGIDIPGFIKAIAEGDYPRANGVLKRTTVLPAICGRVCPQETQCQAVCTVGKMLKSVDHAVAIGRLERYAADWERETGRAELPAVKPPTAKRERKFLLFIANSLFSSVPIRNFSEIYFFH